MLSLLKLLLETKSCVVLPVPMKFKFTETTTGTERVNVTYPRQNRISWILQSSPTRGLTELFTGMPNILNISASGDGNLDKETVETV